MKIGYLIKCNQLGLGEMTKGDGYGDELGPLSRGPWWLMMDRAIISMHRWVDELKGHLDFKGATKGGSARVLILSRVFVSGST